MTRPSGRTRAEIERILDDMTREYVQARGKPPPCVMGERQQDVWAAILKGRILALAYPDEVERLLISRAIDSTLDPLPRVYGIMLLGELSKTGRQASAVTILSLAKSSDRRIQSVALHQLVGLDPNGERRALYLSTCHDDLWGAFDLVALWSDPATVREMERIVAAYPGLNYPDCELRGHAEEVLARLRILDAPDRDAQILRLLDGRDGDPRDWFDWALRVARHRRLPGTLEALRRRLDRTENPLRPDASLAERQDFAEMERLAGRTTENLAKGYPENRRYDDALIAYAELGGALNEIEQQRLYRFGYWGDFRQRLEELLSR